MTGDDLQEWIFKGAPALAALFVAVAAVAMITDDGNQIAALEASAPTSETAMLLVVETESCGWCKRFRVDVAPTYADHGYAGRAPLRFVLLADLTRSGYRLRSSVRAVPTFILIDREGAEVDRIRGYPEGGRAFYTALDAMLLKLGDGRVPSRQ